MAVKPDIAGFQEAQRRLRDEFGVDITFHVPEVPVYPPDTQLDPETGKPFDPTIRPTSGDGFTDVVKHCHVIFRPIHVNLEDPLGDDHLAGGFRRQTSAVLDIDVADFPDVDDASEVTFNGTRYKITDFENDGIVGVDRVLAFLEAK